MAARIESCAWTLLFKQDQAYQRDDLCSTVHLFVFPLLRYLLAIVLHIWWFFRRYIMIQKSILTHMIPLIKNPPSFQKSKKKKKKLWPYLYLFLQILIIICKHSVFQNSDKCCPKWQQGSLIIPLFQLIALTTLALCLGLRIRWLYSLLKE